MFETPAGRLLGGSVAALEQGVRAWKTQPVDWFFLAHLQGQTDLQIVRAAPITGTH